MPHDGIHYWGYRIDTSRREAIEFFSEELKEGRLRQGWGYDPGQDLRDMKVDGGASGNLRMLKEVKKGHILLVPRLPNWGQVAIVEATDDWDKAYQYDISAHGDYGHIFPARFRKSFSRHNEHVVGDLQSTLRARNRFWNIDHIKSDVQRLLDTPQEDLTSDISAKERFENATEGAFKSASDVFSEKAYDVLKEQFEAAGWEKVLVEVLEAVYPGCDVRHTAGPREASHGTDILIEIPGLGRLPRRTRYAIAVQVKDQDGQINVASIMEQISKADSWERPTAPAEDQVTLVEKVVLMTKANKTDNAKLVDAGEKQGVCFVFADDLKDILKDYARRKMGPGANS